MSVSALSALVCALLTVAYAVIVVADPGHAAALGVAFLAAVCAVTLLHDLRHR